MLRRLLTTFLRPYRRDLLVIVALQAVQTLATLTLPTLNADVIDKGVVTGDTGYIWRMGGVMLVVAAVQVVFAVGATFWSARTAMAFGRDVRDALFHRVTSYSAQEVALHGAPSLITRITNDVTQVQLLVLMAATMLVAAPITLAGGVALAIREDGSLSLLLAVSVPVLLLCVGNVVVRMVPQFQLMQERIDRVNQVLREQITGLRVVRAFVREPAEVVRFAGANTALTTSAVRAGRLMAYLFPSVLLVLNVSSVAALWIGAGRIDAGDMGVGSLVAFLSYLAQILIAVMMATFVAVLAPRASVSADRIQDVLDTEPSVRPPAVPVRALPERLTVELDHVTFTYPGAEEPVLADVSIVAEPGRTTAIIGSTGAGKSTLLGLVPRLFDVTGGAVRVGGVDVRDLDPEVLWRALGVVPQKPFLFTGTVATNLRHGRADATDEQLWQALRIAQAADFVAAMPGGLDAAIAQGGANVSGGQRQRLAMARAIVRRPGIYLFDDSFSALDLATDARLRTALGPVTADATVLIVAQRVTTILGADQIVVLEHGRVVGVGTHHELLARCETYAEIVASQLSAEEAA